MTGPTTLPALRRDLRFHRGGEDGTEALLEDPLRNRFFQLPDHVVDWLAAWDAGPAGDLSQRLRHRQLRAPSPDELDELVSFLRDNQLLALDDARSLACIYGEKQSSAFSRFFHAYLFFRIPLLRPQPILNRIWPYVSFFFSRRFAWLTLIAALSGVYLTSRQWDGFRDTFSDLLSLEGAALYGGSLVLIKILHECGHAFMAHRYGVPVPRTGIAFMLLAPVLYTDTTGSWRLPGYQRMMIGAGGLMVELVIAAYSTLAWALLPDGPARSVAFALATLSWVMSVLINLNPFMRFDGYYLFSDLIGIKNLQQRGFAMARWHLRESLFGLGDDPPEILPQTERTIIVLHAYATWTYRFFLFLGIALLVYHAVAKPLGIALFVAEIGFFIVRPIVAEVKVWIERRRRLRINRQSIVTLGVLAAIGLALFAPWQGTIRAPAVLRASQLRDLHLPAPAYVESFETTQLGGSRWLSVRATDPDLAYRRQAAEARLRLAQIRNRRAAADTLERSQSQIFLRQIAAEKAELARLDAIARGLLIVEPGPDKGAQQLVWVSNALHEGRWLDSSTVLGTAIQRGPAVAVAYLTGRQIARIRPGGTATFIPEGPEIAIRRGEIAQVSAAPSRTLDLPILSDAYGGPIAVHEVAGLGHVPAMPRYAVAVRIDEDAKAPPAELRGTIVAEAERQAPIARYARHAATVLLREFNF